VNLKNHHRQLKIALDARLRVQRDALVDASLAHRMRLRFVNAHADQQGDSHLWNMDGDERHVSGILAGGLGVHPATDDVTLRRIPAHSGVHAAEHCRIRIHQAFLDAFFNIRPLFGSQLQGWGSACGLRG
jgi:hypothetical protein